MNLLYFTLGIILVWTVQIQGREEAFRRLFANSPLLSRKSRSVDYKLRVKRAYNSNSPRKLRFPRKTYGISVNDFSLDNDFARQDHTQGKEFRNFYEKSHFPRQSTNDAEPNPPYFLAKADHREPHYELQNFNGQSLKIVPGHIHMRATVMPSKDGNKIVLNSERVGHRIVIGGSDSLQSSTVTQANVPETTLHNALKSTLSNRLDTSTKSSNITEKPINTSRPESLESSDTNLCGRKDCSSPVSENSPEISTFAGSSKNPFDTNEGSADDFNLNDEVPLKNQKGKLNKTSPILLDDDEKIEIFRNLVETDDKNKIKPAGRFFGLFSRNNNTAPACITPKDEPGHCRSFGDCVLPGILSNFNLYLQYMCVISAPRVGVCCPDNPVIEIVDADDDFLANETHNVTIQPSDGCGVNTKTRIVGGTLAKPNEWTWMVALLRKNRFFCGGVLINNWYVLTAAHCAMGMNIRELSVRLGEYNFNEQTKHQQDIPIAEIKRHANFATRTFQHDIALLRLKHSVHFSRFIGTICLPKAGNDFVDVNATVVGWGTVSFGGASSPILRQVTIPVWSNEECDQTYSFEKIDDSFMCAGSPADELDACQGDSGGPLMSLNDQGRWQVIGLVSWGRRCGDPNYPGVYTRVTTYLEWIDENMK